MFTLSHRKSHADVSVACAGSGHRYVEDFIFMLNIHHIEDFTFVFSTFLVLSYFLSQPKKLNSTLAHELRGA